MGKAVNPGETEERQTPLLLSARILLSLELAVCELWDLDIYSCQSLHSTSLHLLLAAAPTHPLFAQILKIRSCENRIPMRFCPLRAAATP